MVSLTSSQPHTILTDGGSGSKESPIAGETQGRVGNQNMGRTLTQDALSLGWVTTKPQSVPPKGGIMDRDTKHFAIVAAIVGILLTLVMLYYAGKSDTLVDDYAKGTLTLNVEKTGWELGRDERGNIVYRQKNYECVRVK